MSAVESLTVTLQLVWNTQFTSGALTCTTVSGLAAASVAEASTIAPASRIDRMIAMERPVLSDAIAGGQLTPLPVTIEQACRVGKGAQRRAHADVSGAHASLCAPYGSLHRGDVERLGAVEHPHLCLAVAHARPRIPERPLAGLAVVVDEAALVRQPHGWP